MNRAAPVRPPSRGALDERSVTVGLGALVLVLGVIDARTLPGVPTAVLDGSTATAVGVLAAFVQAGLMFWSRNRPAVVVVALAAVAAVQYVLVGYAPGYAWVVAAYALGRGPGRLGAPLALASAVPLPVLAWIVPAASPDGSVDAFVDAFVGVSMLLAYVVTGAVFVAIGVVAGRVARAAATRADDLRRTAERERRAAALAQERAGIADEVGATVLVGLRRLVARVLALTPADADDRDTLIEIQREARRTLAGMRRVLTALRAQAQPPVPDPGRVPAVSGRGSAWLPPPPDRSGLLLAGVVAVLVVAEEATYFVLSGHAPGPAAQLGYNPFLVLALTVQVAAVAWWRAAPMVAVPLGAGAAVVAALLGGAGSVAQLAWLVPVWGAATQLTPLRSGLSLAMGVPLLVAGAAVSGRLVGYAVPDVGAAVVVAGAPLLVWATGLLVGRHRRRTDADRDREARTARAAAVTAERMRIARDLHDVVGHHVSALAVQAGAARVLPDRPAVERALEGMAVAAERVAAALPELAELTGDPGADVLDRDGVERLAGAASQAGLPVTVTVSGMPAEQPGDAEVFAGHVIAEALTNVLRHAGPSRTTVSVEHTPTAVVVAVEDTGPVPGHRPSTVGSGLGTIGMRERAALLGGEVECGPHAGGWRVRAVLPRGDGPPS